MYDALTARQGTGVLDFTAQWAGLLLGERDAARQGFRRLRDRDPHWPWRHGWYRTLLDFQCGSISAEQLLAAAGPSHYNQCEAHFNIALTLLAGGDREGARDHFRKTRAAGFFFGAEHQWSGTFLARLDQDPHWPRWIAGGASEARLPATAPTPPSSPSQISPTSAAASATPRP